MSVCVACVVCVRCGVYVGRVVCVCVLLEKEKNEKRGEGGLELLCSSP